MEAKNKNHRIRQGTATANVLFAGHTNVDECPKNQARAEFIERLEVKGTNRWV